MKIGILGTGFGMYHAELYQKSKEVESIRIFGRNREKLDQIRKDTGLEVTNRADDILTDKDVDLVDVCLPSPLHKDFVIEALRNGKDVFCETPVSLTLEDATAMKEAEERYGKRVFVNQFIKYQAPYEYLYHALQSNTSGKLKALHIKRETPQLWGDLSLDKMIINLMMHEFDFITWLLGIPDKISAVGINGKEGQSHMNALLSYNNTVVDIQGSSMMPFSHAFTVGYEAVFENGTIEFIENGYKDRCESSLILFTDSGREELKMEQKNCYEQAIRSVLESCTKGTPTRLSLDAAIQSLKLTLLVDAAI